MVMSPLIVAVIGKVNADKKVVPTADADSAIDCQVDQVPIT